MKMQPLISYYHKKMENGICNAKKNEKLAYGAAGYFLI